jgi:hypothetical protein
LEKGTANSQADPSKHISNVEGKKSKKIMTRTLPKKWQAKFLEILKGEEDLSPSPPAESRGQVPFYSELLTLV